ncbi:MAG: OB-fold domain-containing protein [Elusimicrobia bacterium]|nr:OB-fold domain-containing protein [Elusimicrobiota bacterium]
MAKKNPNLIILSSGEAFQPFRYSVGVYGSRFFYELKENKKFFGVRCPVCRKVYVPPRPLCGPCYRLMDEWVEVGPLGTILSFTILRFAFIDPETGQKKPVPYGYGFIRLDGADTNLQHFLELPKNSAIAIGSRVRPVFQEPRQGNLKDIAYFEIVGG